jgi:hypothetical protein
MTKPTVGHDDALYERVSQIIEAARAHVARSAGESAVPASCARGRRHE